MGHAADDATVPGRSFMLDRGDAYIVWRHRPTGVEVARISDGASVFMQGDDAARLEDELDAAQRAQETGRTTRAPADAVGAEYDQILTP